MQRSLSILLFKFEERDISKWDPDWQVCWQATEILPTLCRTDWLTLTSDHLILSHQHSKNIQHSP